MRPHNFASSINGATCWPHLPVALLTQATCRSTGRVEHPDCLEAGRPGIATGTRLAGSVSSPTEIFRSERLAIRYDARFASDALVVTFMHWVGTPSLDSKGWLEDRLSALELDAVHYISAGNDWFLSQDMEDADGLVAPIAARYREVVTAGTSMGAYQALRGASALRATKAIAIVPQFSIDRAKVPFETRWHEEAAAISSFAADEMRPMPGCRYFVFYDPRQKDDARHVALISAALGGLEEIKITFGGHEVADLLAETDLLWTAFREIIRGQFVAATFRRELRLRRANSPTCLINAARSHVVSDRCREQLLAQAFELGGNRTSVLQSLAQAYAALQRWPEAARSLSAASERRPDDPNIHFHIGYYRSMAGDLAGAAAALRRTVEISPGWFSAWETLAYVLSAIPDPTGALAAAEAALKLRHDIKLAELRELLLEHARDASASGVSVG